VIEQVLVGGAEGDELERKLYVARKTAEKAAAGLDAEMPGIAENFYVCTMSGRVIVYKGMLRSAVVGAFYLDLQDEDFEAQFCIYHRRFSTNTVPKWPLAQPMRFLGHNGEINTLQGNLNWMASKEADMTHPVWDGREAELRPICNPAASDSANLDRVAELLVKSGRPVAETMMLLVPEAYRNHPELDATYPEVEEVLRLLRRHAGGVGRPRASRLHRRQEAGVPPRPQRACAPRASGAPRTTTSTSRPRLACSATSSPTRRTSWLRAASVRGR
jgi:glutamate synthase (ferredoxin)